MGELTDFLCPDCGSRVKAPIFGDREFLCVEFTCSNNECGKMEAWVVEDEDPKSDDF